ncbi:MAG: PD-(D/E)XK nuclease family transposase, partial [Mangrovibacterium sp.]
MILIIVSNNNFNNMPYLDPKNDLTFKRVFGREKNLVISLLNSLLPFSDEQLIESVEYISPEMVP